MLYAIGSAGRERLITKMPHSKDFDRWMKRLSEPDYTKVIEALESRVAGTEVQTSSWIPGSDWTGTPFQPVAAACDGDLDASGLFFGLLVWRMFMDHDDDWSFGHYEVDGVPIRGLTYFRINR